MRSSLFALMIAPSYPCSERQICRPLAPQSATLLSTIVKPVASRLQRGLRETAKGRALDPAAAALELETIARAMLDRAIGQAEIGDVARFDQAGVAAAGLGAAERDVFDRDALSPPDRQDGPGRQADEPAAAPCADETDIAGYFEAR